MKGGLFVTWHQWWTVSPATPSGVGPPSNQAVTSVSLRRVSLPGTNKRRSPTGGYTRKRCRARSVLPGCLGTRVAGAVSVSEGGLFVTWHQRWTVSPGFSSNQWVTLVSLVVVIVTWHQRELLQREIGAVARAGDLHAECGGFRVFLQRQKRPGFTGLPRYLWIFMGERLLPGTNVDQRWSGLVRGYWVAGGVRARSSGIVERR